MNEQSAPEPPQTFTEADRERVRDQLREAVRQLRSRKFEQADRSLDAAQEEANGDSISTEVRAVRLLALAAENFWLTFDEAVSMLGSGGTLELDGQKVVIVEATADAVVVRSRGANRTLPFATMSQDVVFEIAARRFDMAAASTDIHLAAFQIVDPRGDLAEARNRLRRAARRGEREAAEPLLELLRSPTFSIEADP